MKKMHRHVVEINQKVAVVVTFGFVSLVNDT